jgi:hypothetical protein
MTNTSQVSWKKAMFGSRIITVFLVLGFIAMQAGRAQAQWTTNGNNINNTNSGNVGVGTTNPNQKLGVQGMVGIYPQAWVLPSQRGMFMLHDCTAGSIYAFNYPAGTGDPIALSGSILTFQTYVGGSSYARLSIANGGNVGIGTTSPIYSLDVNGGINGFRAKAATVSISDALATFENASGIQAIFRGNGNVGIGASAISPAVKLAIGGNGANVYNTDAWIENNIHVQGNETLGQGGRGRLRIGTAWGYAGLYAEASSTSVANDLVLGSGTGKVRVGPGGGIIQNLVVPDGSVGIGTAAPTEKLEVSGNIKVTGTGNLTASGTITGGTINAKYQDVAEWVESSQSLSAGTVVVLDQTKSNQVVASSQAYDTRVAGVISLQPGITLGENGTGKVLVATTGRVKIKVDASRSSIQRIECGNQMVAKLNSLGPRPK